MPADRYLCFKDIWPRNGRPLLWPVYVWKVLYPAEHNRRVNLFEQAILGLARARCRDRFEMAGLLGLDPELVAFIIAQLNGRGWMSASGAVTPRGEEILEEMEDASGEVCMGYAYQDAISGSWLPRFTGELSELEPERINECGYPVFRCDRDSGKEDSPFRLKHIRKGEQDIKALFEALKRYRIDHEHARQRKEGGDLSDRVRIENLSFVDDDARPMWLWTWIFPDKAGPQAWLVADPFDLQQAVSWLRKPLQEVLPENDALARYIANILGDSRPERQSAAEWLQSLENQIDLELLANYNWLRNHQGIEGYLVSVLRRKALLSGQEGAWQENVTSLLIETHNLAESVLQWLLGKYKPDIRRLPHWKDQQDWKTGKAKDYLESFNLPCLTEDVIDRLSGQRLDQVRTAVAKADRGSLKALLFAGLLATVDRADHPFLGLSADELRLSRLLDMADDRNRKAGHSGGERIDKEEAVKHADFVVEWVKIFKDLY
jgi:hypothetical protein